MARRSWGTWLLASVFAFFAANHLWQVVSGLRGTSDEPTPLVVLHLVIGVFATGAAWTTWRESRFAPPFAIAYGVLTALMLYWLPGLLDLPSEARLGIWLGAAIMLCFGIGSAWWLRRKERQAPTA